MHYISLHTALHCTVNRYPHQSYFHLTHSSKLVPSLASTVLKCLSLTVIAFRWMKHTASRLHLLALPSRLHVHSHGASLPIHRTLPTSTCSLLTSCWLPVVSIHCTELYDTVRLRILLYHTLLYWARVMRSTGQQEIGKNYALESHNNKNDKEAKLVKLITEMKCFIYLVICAHIWYVY